MRPTPDLSTRRVARAARWLIAQHRGRRPFTGFPADCAPLDLGEAYRVQDAFVAEKARGCGAPVGWKIALSNPVMQRFVGLDEAIAGRLFGRQVVGAPGRARHADYGHLLVEFEIAVELAADLPPRSRTYRREDVEAAVAAVRPAFELGDDRGADYRVLNAHALQLVAGNAWTEGVVLGPRRTDWRSLDLGALEGVVTIDDEEVGRGASSLLMGHPLAALAWLADLASRRGIGMRAGEIAILGSLVTSKFPRPGATLRFALDGFQPIELRID